MATARRIGGLTVAGFAGLAAVGCASGPTGGPAHNNGGSGPVVTAPVNSLDVLVAEGLTTSVFDIGETTRYNLSNEDQADTEVTGEKLYGYVHVKLEGISTGQACPSSGFLGKMRSFLVREAGSGGVNLVVRPEGVDYGSGLTSNEVPLINMPLLVMTFDEANSNLCELTVNTGNLNSPYFPIAFAGKQVTMELLVWESKTRQTSLAREISEFGNLAGNNLLAGLAAGRIDAFTNNLMSRFNVNDSETFIRTYQYDLQPDKFGMRVQLTDGAVSDGVLSVELGTRATLHNTAAHRQPPMASPPSPGTILSMRLGAAGETLRDLANAAVGNATTLNYRGYQETTDRSQFLRGCKAITQALDESGLNRWDRALAGYAFYEDKFNKAELDFTECYSSVMIADIEALGGPRIKPPGPDLAEAQVMEIGCDLFMIVPGQPPQKVGRSDKPECQQSVFPTSAQMKSMLLGHITPMLKAVAMSDVRLHADEVLGAGTSYLDAGGVLFAEASTGGAEGPSPALDYDTVLPSRRALESFGCFQLFDARPETEATHDDRPRFEALGRVGETGADVWVRGYFDAVDPETQLARLWKLEVFDHLTELARMRFSEQFPAGCGRSEPLYRSSLVFGASEAGGAVLADTGRDEG